MLFGEIVYGPIHSRRLGVSLGMELMPLEHKVCTFDCVYCECGFNKGVSHPQLPTREQVRETLEKKLQALDKEGTRIDVITFSGNGEPTLHPEFKGIIEDTCALRDQYARQAKVSVLSNSTQLGRTEVVEALRLCDNRILKLDSAIDQTMRLIDAPVNTGLTAAHIEELVRECFGKNGKNRGEEKNSIDNSCGEKNSNRIEINNSSLENYGGEKNGGEEWYGDFTLQTCFLRGKVGVRKDGTIGHGEELNDLRYGTVTIDNTTPEELAAWYAAVDRMRPKEIMIYVIDRATPVHTLEKVSREEMEQIAAPLREKGYRVVVSA